MFTLPSNHSSPLIGCHCLFLKQPILNCHGARKGGRQELAAWKAQGCPGSWSSERGLQTLSHHGRTQHQLCGRLFTCLLCGGKLFLDSQLILTTTLGDVIAPFHRQGN